MTRIELRDFAVWMIQRPFRVTGRVLRWIYRVIADAEMHFLAVLAVLLATMMVAVYDAVLLNGAWDLAMQQQFGIRRVPLYAIWTVITVVAFFIRSLASFRREREQLLRHLRG